jgi:hypothetical protein
VEESIAVYRQIKYIDLKMLNGDNPAGKTLTIENCESDGKLVTLNVGCNWTWNVLQQSDEEEMYYSLFEEVNDSNKLTEGEADDSDELAGGEVNDSDKLFGGFDDLFG